MAYQKSSSHTVRIDDAELYALSLLAAKDRGQTLSQFVASALGNELHVHNRQLLHNDQRNLWRAANGTSLPAPMRSPPKLRQDR